MNKVNYRKICDDILEEIKRKGERPSLFLHVCCAPCSSYVIECLEEFFDITLFFYNPNIAPEEEHMFRLNELRRYVKKRYHDSIKIVAAEYEHGEFLDAVSGFENFPEGSERCFRCYFQRLERTAAEAEKRGFEWFCTTLSVSPYKNSQKICEIGKALESKFDVRYLVSDFKKRGGYLRSIELSKEYGLYRQNYCGCPFSKKEALMKKSADTTGV